MSQGYSPLLTFEVDADPGLDQMIPRLLMEFQGTHLDGPIKYPGFGKVATLRTPDGHMVSLFEANPDVFPHDQEQS